MIEFANSEFMFAMKAIEILVVVSANSEFMFANNHGSRSWFCCSDDLRGNLEAIGFKPY